MRVVLLVLAGSLVQSATGQAEAVAAWIARAQAVARAEPERAAALLRRALAAAALIETDEGERLGRLAEEHLVKIDGKFRAAQAVEQQAAEKLLAAAREMQAAGWNRAALRLATQARRLCPDLAAPLVAELSRGTRAPVREDRRSWGRPVPSAANLADKKTPLARLFAEALCFDAAEEWQLSADHARSPVSLKSLLIGGKVARPARLQVEVKVDPACEPGLMFGLSNPNDFYLVQLEWNRDGEACDLVLVRYLEHSGQRIARTALPVGELKEWLAIEVRIEGGSVEANAAGCRVGTVRWNAGAVADRHVGLFTRAETAKPAAAEFRNLLVEEW